MLTIELDKETELALQELAQQQGKTSEQWFKEIIAQFVMAQTRPQILPDLAEFRAKFPMQEMSAGEFCRAMRDEANY
jgi:predicted transcriptional regulator